MAGLAGLALMVPPAAAQGVITTVAGSTWIFRGNGSPATQVPLGPAGGVAVDASGNLYVADIENHIVAKIAPSGVLTVVAGNGVRGVSGDGGLAIRGSLNYPKDVALDAAGNLYIAHNNRVRRVTAGGIITTYAGSGVFGFSGDGGPATAANFNDPYGVAVDAAGNLYISDTFNHRIRKVSPGGIISTFAGTGTGGFSGDGGPATSAMLYEPRGLALDPGGNLYVADTRNNRVRVISSGGVITTVAGNGVASVAGDGGSALSASLNPPWDVALDGLGNLYISHFNRVRKVTPNGTITTVAGSGFTGFSGDGGPARSAALDAPQGIAVDAAGALYIADSGNERVRKVAPDGTITTVAGNGSFRFSGDGGPATSASLYLSNLVTTIPNGLAVDAAGNLLIADVLGERVRKVSPNGLITTVAGTGIRGYSGDGGPATNASLNNPSGLAVAADGTLYIADLTNQRIRKITPDGTISTVAGRGVAGFSGDGGPATGASINGPLGLALDASGNLYFADQINHRIRRVTPGGTIDTVAGTGVGGFSGDGGPARSAALNFPVAVALDALGNLYITDLFNLRIRKVDAGGTISTLAGNGVSGSSGDGGPATSASLRNPNFLALDAVGNLYIADSGNNRVRRVGRDGVIKTVAGTGTAGFSGDGGVPTSALLSSPRAVTLDAAGNLYISDWGNQRVRKVLVTAPSFAVSPASLTFSAITGSSSASQQLRLSGSVGGLGWQATVRTSGGAWLSVSPSSGQMPATVAVTANAANLAAGSYQGTIEIAAPLASPSTLSVAVTLTVTSAQPANFSVQPALLNFRAVAGALAPPSQGFLIENQGSGTLSWTARAAVVGGSWLAVSPASGGASASTPGRVQVSVNPAGLAAGSYSGSVTVSSSTTGQSLNVPVTLLVSAPVGVLLLSQEALLFRAVEGGGAEPPQTFSVLNTGSGSMDWTAAAVVRDRVSWLQVSPASGRSDAGSSQIPQVTVSVDATGLAAGFYVGQVRVTSQSASNSPQVVRVDLYVLPRGTRLGSIVRPTGLVFVAAVGGTSPGSQDVSLATTEESLVEFLTQPIGGDWVTRAPESGTATRASPARIVVQPDVENLAAGIYRAALTVFTTNDGEVHPVRLLFVVLPQGTVTPAMRRDGTAGAQACTPTQLLLQFASLFSSVNATVGWPTTVLVNARDDCGNPAVGGTVTMSFSSGDPTLALADLKNGQYQASWRPNSSNAQVVVTARGSWQGLQGETTSTASVGVNPNPQTNILAQGGVLLGAGFQRGPVAPGSIISLFGQKLAPSEMLASSLPLPKTLNGVRVLISGQEAPLFYVGPGQVNAQVPAELSGDRQLQVVVETNGVPSAPEPVQTAGNRPGIFTLGGSFGDQGAILIANTDRLAMPVTANVPSEPVPVGGYISIYCTGLGPTDPPVGSGEPGPSGPLAVVKTPVTVTIGGVAGQVVFAGLAPGFAGVYQVNAQVPAGVTPGNAVAVVLTQGNFQSNAATIAVK